MSLFPEHTENRSSTFLRLWDRLRHKPSTSNLEPTSPLPRGDNFLVSYHGQSSEILPSQTRSSRLASDSKRPSRSTLDLQQTGRCNDRPAVSAEQANLTDSLWFHRENSAVAQSFSQKEKYRHAKAQVNAEFAIPSDLVCGKQGACSTLHDLGSSLSEPIVRGQSLEEISGLEVLSKSILKSLHLSKSSNDVFASDNIHLYPKLYPLRADFCCFSQPSEASGATEQSARDIESCPFDISSNETSIGCIKSSGHFPSPAALSESLVSSSNLSHQGSYTIRLASYYVPDDQDRKSPSSSNDLQYVNSRPSSEIATTSGCDENAQIFYPRKSYSSDDMSIRNVAASKVTEQHTQPLVIRPLDLSLLHRVPESEGKPAVKDIECRSQTERPSSSSRWSLFSLGVLARLPKPLTPRRQKRSEQTNAERSSLTEAKNNCSEHNRSGQKELGRNKRKLKEVQDDCTSTHLKETCTQLLGDQPDAAVLSRQYEGGSFCPSGLSTFVKTPLICRLGNGKYSRRVFIIRTPSKLGENVILADSAQTTLLDIRRLLHSQRSAVALLMGSGNSHGQNPPPDSSLCAADKSAVYKRVAFDEHGRSSAPIILKQQQLWQGFLLWDLPIHRSMLSPEVKSEFQNQVLTYRLLDCGAPPLFFVTQLCSSILYWLQLDQSETQGAFISFYEKSPIFLAVLGCVLLCLDNQALIDDSLDCVPQLPSLEDVSSALRRADIEGRLAWKEASANMLSEKESCQQLLEKENKLEEPPTISKIASNNVISEALSSKRTSKVLDWRPLSEWTPGSKRMLANFRKLLSPNNFADGLKCHPFRIKTLMINKFPGPACGVVVEIYQIYDLRLTDGHTQRSAATHRALLRRATIYDYSRAGHSSRQFSDDLASDVTATGAKFESNRRGRQPGSPLGCLGDLSDDFSIEPKKKGLFGEITSHATRSLWGYTKSKSKERDDRGCHLLGPYGFAKAQHYVGRRVVHF